MDTRLLLAMALDPGAILRARGFTVDQWQTDVLLSRDRQPLLNCRRQAGKSTVVSALALHTALFQPGSLTLILSPGRRQSSETFKKVIEGYSAIGRPLKADYETQLRIELANNRRILRIPGALETVRCYSPNLVIIDEAARVADDLYRAIRPMLTVSRGCLVVLSTPFGQRGWFYDEWQSTGPRAQGPRHLEGLPAHHCRLHRRGRARLAGRGSPRNTRLASTGLVPLYSGERGRG
jgi:hypothetical protein